MQVLDMKIGVLLPMWTGSYAGATASMRQLLDFSRHAERAGLERKTISRIENQHLSPTIDTLVRIALVLRCDVAELIDGA